MIQSAFLVTGFEPSTTPPDGPPTTVQLYTYSGGRIGVAWINGDIDAETEIAYIPDPTGLIEPDAGDIVTTVAPNYNIYETGLKTQVCTYWIRHKRGGQTTVWVKADRGSIACAEA